MRSPVKRVAKALLPLMEGTPEQRAETAQQLAWVAVMAMREPRGPGKKPGPKPKPAPKPRSIAERVQKPITESDWDLYFENRRAKEAR